MSALRILGWWTLAACLFGALWAALRALLITKTCPCSHCRDLARQLADAKEHIRLLERANAGLAAKVTQLEARRSGRAS